MTDFVGLAFWFPCPVTVLSCTAERIGLISSCFVAPWHSHGKRVFLWLHEGGIHGNQPAGVWGPHRRRCRQVCGQHLEGENAHAGRPRRTVSQLAVFLLSAGGGLRPCSHVSLAATPTLSLLTRDPVRCQGFATSLSIVLSSVVSYFFLNFILTRELMVGGLTMTDWTGPREAGSSSYAACDCSSGLPAVLAASCALQPTSSSAPRWCAGQPTSTAPTPCPKPRGSPPPPPLWKQRVSK